MQFGMSGRLAGGLPFSVNRSDCSATDINSMEGFILFTSRHCSSMDDTGTIARDEGGVVFPFCERRPTQYVSVK